MALLGIIAEFEVQHGSKEIRKDNFTVELTIDGPIKNGFVAGVDYVKPKKRLNEIISELSEKYLDDIVGRATNENIAQYLMFNLRDLPLHSIKVSEGDGIYVEISKDEFDAKMYPSQLSYNFGHSFLLRENPEKAKEHFTEAIALNAKFAEAYNMRGRCFKYLNDYQSALSDFLKAIEINPNLGEAWRNLGNAYLYLERFDEMIPAFDRSVELMPDSALAINNRGYGYYVKGEYELALKDHERAVKIDPNYAEAHYDKAMALKALGRDKEAQQALSESERLKQSAQDTYHGIKMY
ncbi:MAG: tetratricopeptide repeat protein [Candidatus Heimdallarchaeaceae archaeon]